MIEDQLHVLEKVQEEKQIHGEIETGDPGYLGFQNIDGLDNIKGFGRIDQQAFFDGDCKTTLVKRYVLKRGMLVVVDMLGEQVRCCFGARSKVLGCCFLTDQGSKCCGNRSEFALCLRL